MSSSSKSDQSSSTTSEDNRIVADGGAIAVGSDSAVTINQVPDEVLAFGGQLVDRAFAVIEQDVKQRKSEGAQLSGDLIKFGLPLAAVAFILKG